MNNELIYLIDKRLFKISGFRTDLKNQCNVCLFNNSGCINYNAFINNTIVNKCYFLSRIEYEEIKDKKKYFYTN